MKRKIYVLVLALVMLLSFPLASFASSNMKPENTNQLEWVTLDIANQYFDVSSGIATIEAVTTGVMLLAPRSQ